MRISKSVLLTGIVVALSTAACGAPEDPGAGHTPFPPESTYHSSIDDDSEASATATPDDNDTYSNAPSAAPNPIGSGTTIIVSSCEGGVRLLNWVDPGSGMSVKRRYFNTAGSVQTVATCNRNIVGAQVATGFNSDFSRLVVTKQVNDDEGAHIGYLTAGKTVSDSKFVDLSGVGTKFKKNQRDIPGSFDNLDRIWYKRYTPNKYELVSMNAFGYNRRVQPLDQDLADDNVLYLPHNGKAFRPLGGYAPVILPGGNSGIFANGNYLLYGNPTTFGKLQVHRVRSSNGSNVPIPFSTVGRSQYWGYDDVNIYWCKVGNTVKTERLMDDTSYSIRSPRLSPTGKYIAYMGVNGNSSMLYVITTGGKLVYTMNFHDDDYPAVLAWKS